jgi:endoglucanase
MNMTRRDVLRGVLTTAGLGALGTPLARAQASPRALPDATPQHLPRWRGFNLLNKFMADHQKPFAERDFADIAELGFDFVRLPLDYRCWTDRGQPRGTKEPVKEIDNAVEAAANSGFTSRSSSTGLQVSRSPNLRSEIAGPIRRFWKSASHWSAFAGATRGSPTQVSFDPFNEPDDKVKPDDHRRVGRIAVDSPRDPN